MSQFIPPSSEVALSLFSGPEREGLVSESEARPCRDEVWREPATKADEDVGANHVVHEAEKPDDTPIAMGTEITDDWRKRLGIGDLPSDHAVYREPPRLIFLRRREKSASVGQPDQAAVAQPAQPANPAAPTPQPNQAEQKPKSARFKLDVQILMKQAREGLRSQSEMTDESSSPTIAEQPRADPSGKGGFTWHGFVPDTDPIYGSGSIVITGSAIHRPTKGRTNSVASSKAQNPPAEPTKQSASMNLDPRISIARISESTPAQSEMADESTSPIAVEPKDPDSTSSPINPTESSV